jgi:hypothetical protein
VACIKLSTSHRELLSFYRICWFWAGSILRAFKRLQPGGPPSTRSEEAIGAYARSKDIENEDDDDEDDGGLSLRRRTLSVGIAGGGRFPGLKPGLKPRAEARSPSRAPLPCGQAALTTQYLIDAKINPLLYRAFTDM